MAFTLSIHFSGLCLFVPEPATATTPDRMHVLLPSATGSHHHTPVVQFDAAHLMKPGSTPVSPSEVVCEALIRSGAMEFAGGQGADLTICPEIADVRGAAGTSVLPGLFTGNPGGLLAARITLTSGRIVAVSPGMCWTWKPGQRKRFLAHNAWWRMDVNGTDLPLPCAPLVAGSQVPTLPVLYPMGPTGDQRVNISILHLPREEHGLEPPAPTPPPSGVAMHFGMYFPLFGLNTAPLLPRDPVEEECGPFGCEHWEWKGSSSFNCMLGGG